MSARALESFLDREAFPLEEAARAWAGSSELRGADFSLARLVELSARLPSGLVHAESIALFAEAPPGLVPLAEGSAWFASGATLVAVPGRSRSALRRLLADLAAYFVLAERFRSLLGPRPELVVALSGTELDPAARAELALLLDAAPVLIEALDHRAPRLRADLAAIASRVFQPMIRLHAALRSAHLAVRGARIAEELLAQLPDAPVRLLLTDTSTALELLSPYVRDLGLALSRWALENPQRLATRGLAEAIDDTGERASVDLAALVAPDLHAAHPELLMERREAERSAGLYLFDAEDVVFGFAELSRLSAPDDAAVLRGATGTLAVLSTRSEATMLEVLRALLETGRLTAAALVLGAAADVPGVLLADALASERDGVVLSRSEELAERAQRMGIEAHRLVAAPVADDLGVPEVAFELLGLCRRARALGRFHEDGVVLVSYPRGQGAGKGSISVRLWEVQAGRLALSFLSDQGDPRFDQKPRRGVSHKAPGVSRRFRA